MNKKRAFEEYEQSRTMRRLTRHSFGQSSSDEVYYRKRLSSKLWISFGYHRLTILKPLPRHFHKIMEVVYHRHGCGGYYIAGRLYNIRKRQLLIVKPNEIHQYLAAANEEAGVVILGIPLDWLGLGLDFGSWPNEVLLSETEAAQLEMIFGQISEEVRGKEAGYENMLRPQFQLFCYHVNRIISRPEIKQRENPILVQLKEYLDKHLAEQINLGIVSKTFGYTPAHLTREFRKDYGVSPKRYILMRRIMEARLVMETERELKMSAVAERVGFGEYHLFYRSFKKFAGVTPDAYRRLINKSHSK